MGWSTTVKNLKRNSDTAASQIGYVFKELCGKIISTVMHPIGKILNFNNGMEFQNRGNACSNSYSWCSKYW